MKSFLTRKHAVVIAKLIVAAFLTFAWVALTRMAQVKILDYQVKIMTTEQRELKMKTICAGRFLIDVPADAEVTHRGAAVAGWDIATTTDETNDQFATRLQAKEDKLAGEKNEKDLVSLERVMRVDLNGAHGRIFVFGREWVSGLPGKIPTQIIKLQANVRSHTHSFDFTSEIKFDSDLTELEQLVTQIRQRAPDGIPKEGGFCFDGGFITEPLSIEQSERTTMFVGLAGHPDVSIVFDMTAAIDTPKSLLERDDENTIRSSYSSHFHTLRRGPLSIAGQAGEQLLERVSENNGTAAHAFQWEVAHNKKDSVFTPMMSFEMSTGNGRPGTSVQSSLSDVQALVLWDKMLSSIRVRPVQTAEPVAVNPAPAPLGTWANAGDPCPQSGWWECTDGDNGIDVLGGRAQFYRTGERMAQATLYVPSSVWQRLGRKRATFTSKIPSPWKLIDRRSHPRVITPLELAQALSAPLNNVVAHVQRADDVEHENPTVLAGTRSHSGLLCPASGWWLCTERGALDGTRWFARGQQLPLATVLGRPKLLDNIKGTPGVTRRAAPWKLARLDDGSRPLNPTADQ